MQRAVTGHAAVHHFELRQRSLHTPRVGVFVVQRPAMRERAAQNPQLRPQLRVGTDRWMGGAQTVRAVRDTEGITGGQGHLELAGEMSEAALI